MKGIDREAASAAVGEGEKHAQMLTGSEKGQSSVSHAAAQSLATRSLCGYF